MKTLNYKRVTRYFGYILLAGVLFSCKNETSKIYNEILGGKHELRKFNVKTTISQSSSTFYFLVVGSYSSHTTESTIVRFYFLNCKGEFQLMERRLTEVNIKIDSTVIKPFVKFYWCENSGRTKNEYTRMYNYDVTKVVIYCKDSDFQPELNINELR